MLEVVWAHRPRPYAYSTVIGGFVVLYGWAIRETSGSATAQLDIYNGAQASGDDIISIALAAGQSTREWFGPQGLELQIGYYPNLVSGAITGSVFIGDLEGSTT